MFQILIVDDDKNTRHYLSTVLADAGYTPYTASSASEALTRIKEIPFDLLVIDIMMPGMDGYEFTRLLRDCRYDLPILMLSAKQIACTDCKILVRQTLRPYGNTVIFLTHHFQRIQHEIFICIRRILVVRIFQHH